HEVGAGLQISPNGAKVLHRLGLEAGLAATACLPDAVELRSAHSGALILSTPLGETIRRRYGAPWYNMHRGDLHTLLMNAVRERCGEPAVRTGQELTGLEDDGAQVILTFAGGDTGSADVVVGADGIHSRTREILAGADLPKFTGHVAWRGLVPAERLKSLALRKVVTSWMAPGSHAVTYFVRRGELVNFVGIREHRDALPESWNGRGDNATLLADLDDWHPTVRQIAEAIQTPLCWGLFTHGPLPSWTRGRIALLGDACHPMLPYMAQGAVMAIEDAWVLAASLKEAADVPRALRTYQSRRFARATRVQEIAQRNGKLFHLEGARRAAVFGAMAIGSRILPGVVAARHDWIVGFDPLAQAGR
ncbi:MAG TPA: FAD-dependent monooxygenase, partial [Pseudomonadales bacterium]|nr:FAD-dependent monooxygenase [Pseudomonadales bacterium]